VTYFRVGSSSHEHVIVRTSPRPSPEAIGQDDDWISATIEIAAGAFRGCIHAMLRTEELVRFRDELRPLYERLSGRATFDATEGWLRIDIEGDAQGHFRAACEAIDMPGTGNRLVFGIALDQTELPAIIRELDIVCEAGQPTARIRPPWEQFKGSDPTWSGWRQGISEAWLLDTWRPFWQGLSADARARYLQTWPPPDAEWEERLREWER
jgi:hypothetical protein